MQMPMRRARDESTPRTRTSSSSVIGDKEEVRPSRRRARPGDVVRIDLSLVAENGFVPEKSFDTEGEIAFCLGWGNYLPGLHELVTGCAVGDSVQGVSIDAGWGKRQEDLMVKLPKAQLGRFVSDIDALEIGQSIRLNESMNVVVAEISNDGDNTVVVDANPPLAGSSYACSFRVLSIDEVSDSAMEYNTSTRTTRTSQYGAATFAMGCFWGVELAFLRLPGVVGTQVGYSQGVTRDPTYDEVCAGQTQHRESVLVVYDRTAVDYKALLELALKRLAITTPTTGLARLFEQAGESAQYRHGFYYHNEEQRRLAEEALLSNNNRFAVELLPANKFYVAEDDHQKFLYKGGQSTRKDAKETIRCYG